MRMQVLQLTLGSEALSTVEANLLADVSTPVDDTHLTLHANDFGIPESVAGIQVRDEQFMLPPALLDLLRRALDRSGEPETLWVQLIEPFGYLGFVPWERLIQAQIAVSVARLPTLTLARRKPTNSLQVAILAPVPDPRRHGSLRTLVHSTRLTAGSVFTSGIGEWFPPEEELLAEPALAGLRSDREFSAEDLDRVVRAVLSGSPRTTTTVHVVTTPWVYHDLKALWRGRDWPVQLHDPYRLVSALQSDGKKSPVEASWLELLRIAQGGEQADVVHLICHGSVTDTKARLIFADPLRTNVNVASRYVSLPVLMSALDQVGAWSVCLTAPPGAHSAPHLRYLGCRLAELRPGPLLMTDLATDPFGLDIAAAYKFLYAPTPSAAPRLQTGMLACEPYRASADVSEFAPITREVELEPNEQPRAEVASLIASDSTPIWVAAAQRFIEQRQVELTKLERDAPIGARSPEARYITQGIRQALGVIQDAVVSYAQRTRGDHE